jgi:hypothetical protein
MKFSMTGLETGDLLIEVTTRINLTVYPFSWNRNCHIMISLKSFSSNDSDTMHVYYSIKVCARFNISFPYHIHKGFDKKK